jgi:hypothetical protein
VTFVQFTLQEVDKVTEHAIRFRDRGVVGLGLSPREFFEAGARGAVCDDETRAWLRDVGAAYDWAAE